MNDPSDSGSSEPEQPSSPTNGSPPAPSSSSGRQWRVAAGTLAVIAAVGLGAYAVTAGGGGRSCLTDAAEHLELPDEEGLGLNGGHLQRARAAGFDDSGSPEDFEASLRETGVNADPTTAARGQVEKGFDSPDIMCWVGTGSDFVARGTFDVGEVEASEVAHGGRLAASSSLLALDGDGDAARLLERRSNLGGEVSTLLDALDDRSVISFGIAVPAADEDTRTPVAVAQTRDGEWELLIIWLFDDGDEAEHGLEVVTDLLTQGESRIPDIVRGDPVDHLHQSGSLLVLQAPLDDPATWRDPFLRADPVLVPLDPGR